jgi:hypothetical protein
MKWISLIKISRNKKNQINDIRLKFLLCKDPISQTSAAIDAEVEIVRLLTFSKYM